MTCDSKINLYNIVLYSTIGREGAKYVIITPDDTQFK
jgi:hypothetical protein